MDSGWIVFHVLDENLTGSSFHVVLSPIDANRELAPGKKANNFSLQGLGGNQETNTSVHSLFYLVHQDDGINKLVGMGRSHEDYRAFRRDLEAISWSDFSKETVKDATQGPENEIVDKDSDGGELVVGRLILGLSVGLRRQGRQGSWHLFSKVTI